MGRIRRIHTDFELIRENPPDPPTPPSTAARRQKRPELPRSSRTWHTAPSRQAYRQLQRRHCRQCGESFVPFPLFRGLWHHTTSGDPNATKSRVLIDPGLHQQSGCQQRRAPHALPSMNPDGLPFNQPPMQLLNEPAGFPQGRRSALVFNAPG